MNYKKNNIINMIEKKINTKNFSFEYNTKLYHHSATINKNDITVYNEDTKCYIEFRIIDKKLKELK